MKHNKVNNIDLTAKWNLNEVVLWSVFAAMHFHVGRCQLPCGITDDLGLNQPHCKTTQKARRGKGIRLAQPRTQRVQLFTHLAFKSIQNG
jgi:hypothetical protein